MHKNRSIQGLAIALLLALAPIGAQAAAHNLSGYISGLNRGESVTLLQNGTDALTVTTNGTFKFATSAEAGASYRVSVGLQPKSEVCSLDAAESGEMPDADVTDVRISCAASTGPGLAGSWWIPYTASPVPSTVGGLTGLFLIASDQIHSAPKQQFIVNTAAKILAAGVDASGSGGIDLAQPTTLMYSAVGSDGNTHIYGIPINNTAVVPTPVQLTKLSVPATQAVCQNSGAQSNLTTGTTLFIVVEVSTPPCGMNPSTIYIIHYTDPATLAPKKLTITTSDITYLYNNGVLTGRYLFNSATQSLNYYKSNTFTTPKELVTSVGSVTQIASTANIANGTAFGASAYYPAVTGVTPGGNALYRIESTSAGTATLIHAGTVTEGVVDNANLYFQDTTSATASIFYQVGLTANTPKQIFSGSITPPATSYTLLGTDTVRLAFQQTQITTAEVTTINTIPIGVNSTATTVIAGPYSDVGVLPLLASPAVNDWVDNKLFVSIFKVTEGTTPKYAISSTATPLSTVAPAPKAKSYYESFGEVGVWQAKGITATDDSLGGATINEVNIATLADSPLTTTGGANFKIPAHYSAFLAQIGSGSVAAGFLEDTSGTLPSIGLACDVAGKFIIEVKDTNTNVQTL